MIAINCGFVYGEENPLEVINEYLEPTYITPTDGIHFQGDDERWYSKWFEAEINNHLRWFSISNSFMMINPKIQLRMYNEESAPVKTPGYLPRLTYFFWLGGGFESGKQFRYNSIMLSHHSNGQAGSFYNSDGTVNKDSGNFSTNFFEFAHYEIMDRDYFPRWSKISLEWHPGFNREKNLKDQYETVKLKLNAQSGDKNMPCSDSWKYNIWWGVSYILAGRDYIIAPNKDYPLVNPKKAEWIDNINLTAGLNIKLPFFDQLNIFMIKYDYGYDYYNIRFQDKINRIQIGFAGKI